MSSRKHKTTPTPSEDAIEDVIDALIGAARQGDVSACESILSRYLPRLRAAELRREEQITLTYVIDEQDLEA